MSTSPHIADDDLILRYYGELPDEAAVEAHIATCAECRRAYARLTQVLAIVDAEALNHVESPRAGFERDVWARLEPHLPRRARWWHKLSRRSPRWAVALGMAALLIGTFVAGRSSRGLPEAPTTQQASGDVAERVLVVAVVDHLDRSQMVLLEVLNSDATGGAALAVEQSLARELVAANRLYRYTAAHTGDERMGAVLDELERVLLEIANTPADADTDTLDALRARIASQGLLFKVRVVHSEMRERERQRFIAGSTS
jgi:predicted anti-sigma-YlaC factor YlaD